MRFYCSVFLSFALSACCSAELPGYYKSVDRLVWIVGNVDHVSAGWAKLGMSDIHRYPNTMLNGWYRNKPVTIHVSYVTGRLGDVTIDMLQPAKGERNAFTGFLSRHGDGIFAIVHAASGGEEVDREIRRLRGHGVGVLQQVAFDDGAGAARFTFFDTDPRGKFVLGIVTSPNGASPAKSAMKISHIAPVVREAESVAAFWQHLGFPGFTMQHATPREDSRYRGKSLLLSFDVGFQRTGQISYEWIVPPTVPPNIYADFLRLHGEGIQHLGVPVDNLEEAAAVYEKLGYAVWQSGAWGDVGKAHSGQYKYMDTDSIGGVSVELIHAY